MRQREYSAVSRTGSEPVIHAFLYNHGTMLDLGTLGGADSVANDINAHGEIVGLPNLLIEVDNDGVPVASEQKTTLSRIGGRPRISPAPHS